MMLNDKIFFTHLPKCGGSFMLKLLNNNGYHDTKGGAGHKNYESSSTIVDFNNVLAFGLVRNPWDWYVSLYRYCITRKSLGFGGVLFRKSSNNYKNNFNDYMRSLLNDFGAKDMFDGQNMGLFNVSNRRDLGLFTLQYIYHFYGVKYISNEVEELPDSKFIIGKLEEIDTFIPNLFNTHNLPLTYNIKTKINVSDRDSDYRKYYEDDVIELVREKDKLIIDKFNYEF